jgi:hypothetical protein
MFRWDSHSSIRTGVAPVRIKDTDQLLPLLLSLEPPLEPGLPSLG